MVLSKINITDQSKRSALLVLGCSGLFIVSACSLDEPTRYHQSKMEVHEKYYDHSYDVRSLNDDKIAAMAHDYRKGGSGGINVTVTYDPHSSHHTARYATETAADIANAFRKEGIRDVRTDILPIINSETSDAHISFNYLEAHAPADCTRLDQIDDSGVENYREYQLSCTTDTFLAKQVAHPEDLLGRAESQHSIGRRETNIVDGHKAGIQRGTLEGETTTGD